MTPQDIAKGALGIEWRDTETAARLVAMHAAELIESHSRQLWLDSQVSAATEVLLRERRLHNADCGCQAAPEGRCDWDAVITRLEGEFARIKGASK